MKLLIISLSIIFLLTSCNYQINKINNDNITFSGTKNIKKAINNNTSSSIEGIKITNVNNNEIKQDIISTGSIEENKSINNKIEGIINYNTGSKVINNKSKDLGNGFNLEKNKDYSKLMYKGKDILYFGSLFTKENYINSISKINDRFYKIFSSNQSIILFDSKKNRIDFFKKNKPIINQGIISNEVNIKKGS